MLLLHGRSANKYVNWKILKMFRDEPPYSNFLIFTHFGEMANWNIVKLFRNPFMTFSGCTFD